jgi:hypothetical protein
MRKTSARKLFLFGKYSLALLPPKKWLRELGVEAGDQAQVEFDRTKKRLIVSFTGKPGLKTKESKNPSGKDDWQPIPQL